MSGGFTWRRWKSNRDTIISDYFYYGSVGFTPLGEELFELATPTEVPGFFDYLESAWAGRGVLRIPEGWDFERDGIMPTGGNAPDGSPPRPS